MTATKGTKINDLARVSYVGQSDGMTGVGVVDFVLFANGRKVTWRPNGADFEHIQRHIAPLSVGDEVALSGFVYGDTLRRVRYTCRGREFRGMAAL